MPSSIINISSSGTDYTVSDIQASLPSTASLGGTTFSLTWSAPTIELGRLKSLTMTYPSVSAAVNNSAASRTNTIHFPLSTSATSREDYGEAKVVTGQSVIGTGSSAVQNGLAADATLIASALATGTDNANKQDATKDARITADFTSTTKGATIIWERNDGSNTFPYAVSDGLGGGGLGKVFKEVANVSDLPLVCANNFKVEVSGDVDIDQDNYYVQFETDSDTDLDAGTWNECVGVNTKVGLDAATLPMRLKSIGKNGSGVDVFDLEEIVYNERKAGDDDTNEAPSFVGSSISNMFFFKDRLGFLSEDNIIMSEKGHPFNFYRTTVAALLDSDPIDISAASGKVTQIKAATGFQDNLILFAENGQFVLKSGDVLAPRSVSITPITNFIFEGQVDPLPLGSYIYFPFTRGKYTGVREFMINGQTDIFDSVEVTEHVPAYIPKNIISIAGTTSEDILVALSGDQQKSLYVYNYFWNNNKKVLSSWSKFTFDKEINGMDFIESTLYMVMTDKELNKTSLMKLPMETGLLDATQDFDWLSNRQRVKIASGEKVLRFKDSSGVWQDTLNASSNPTYTNSTALAPLAILLDDGTYYNGDELIKRNGTAGANSITNFWTLPEHVVRDKYGWIGTVTGDYVRDRPVNTFLDERFAAQVEAGSNTVKVQEPIDGEYTSNLPISMINTPAGEVSPYVFVSGGTTYNCTTSASGTVLTRTSAAATTANTAMFGYFGLPFTMKYKFSTQIFKANAGNSQSPTASSDMQIRNGSIFFNETNSFDVKVTAHERQEQTNTFTANKRPDAVTKDGVKMVEGYYRFPVHSKAKYADITIESSNPYEVKVNSAEFESFVHPRSQRYG